MHEFGIVVGRFQPFHNAHLELVRFALKQAQNLIVVLGSDSQAATIKNPWSSDERSQMIRSCFSEEENKRIEFVRAKDFYSSNMMWCASVQKSICALTGDATDIKLIGHKKDASSFYLSLFPQWGDYIEFESKSDIGATKVRKLLFELDSVGFKNFVPPQIYDYLKSYMESSEFERLHGEYHDVLADKSAWVGAPFQPIFVTTDAVVIVSGHVLVVRRRGKYGKGLIALPGGYVKASESLVNSCIRELKEETAIKVDAKTLKTMVVEKDVFDHPGRDLRGRVITHAFCIKLPDGELPRVKGSDDADKAWWMTYNDVLASEAKFFGDHYHIINRFAKQF